MTISSLIEFTVERSDSPSLHMVHSSVFGNLIIIDSACLQLGNRPFYLSSTHVTHHNKNFISSVEGTLLVCSIQHPMGPPVKHEAQHTTGQPDEQPRHGSEHGLAAVAIYFLQSQ